MSSQHETSLHLIHNSRFFFFILLFFCFGFIPSKSNSIMHWRRKNSGAMHPAHDTLNAGSSQFSFLYSRTWDEIKDRIWMRKIAMFLLHLSIFSFCGRLILSIVEQGQGKGEGKETETIKRNSQIYVCDHPYNIKCLTVSCTKNVHCILSLLFSMFFLLCLDFGNEQAHNKSNKNQFSVDFVFIAMQFYVFIPKLFVLLKFKDICIIYNRLDLIWIIFKVMHLMGYVSEILMIEMTRLFSFLSIKLFWLNGLLPCLLALASLMRGMADSITLRLKRSGWCAFCVFGIILGETHQRKFYSDFNAFYCFSFYKRFRIELNQFNYFFRSMWLWTFW